MSQRARITHLCARPDDEVGEDALACLQGETFSAKETPQLLELIQPAANQPQQLSSPVAPAPPVPSVDDLLNCDTTAGAAAAASQLLSASTASVLPVSTQPIKAGYIFVCTFFQKSQFLTISLAHCHCLTNTTRR